jgi:1-acyl-sn-glycerol-3-phosphate acyltransferase
MRDASPFLPAAKHPVGGALVGALIRNSVRRHFSRVRLRERTPLAGLDRRLPLLLVASHVSWWDGYLMYLLERRAGRDGYFMMEERQLARYGFFRWIGCFSVDRDHPRRAMATLHYAADLLTGAPNRVVIIFPQGSIAPNDHRPLTLASGAARLCRLAGPTLVAPAALRYEHLADQHPDAFISVGPVRLVEPAEARDPRALTAEFARLLTDEMDGLRAAVLAGQTDGFTQLMAGRASVSDVYDRTLGRWLAALRRPGRRR